MYCMYSHCVYLVCIHACMPACVHTVVVKGCVSAYGIFQAHPVKIVFFLYHFQGYISGIVCVFLAGEKVEKEKSTNLSGKALFFPIV